MSRICASRKVNEDNSGKNKENRDYIASRLDLCERLAQLSEECCELSQAALKLRRVIDGKNPARKSREECEADLFEEVADVLVCLKVTALYFEHPECDKILQKQIDYKLNRWAKGLKQIYEKVYDNKSENETEGGE